MITLKTPLWAIAANVAIRTKGLLTTCPSSFPPSAKFGFADISPLSVKSHPSEISQLRIFAHAKFCF